MTKKQLAKHAPTRKFQKAQKHQGFILGRDSILLVARNATWPKMATFGQKSRFSANWLIQVGDDSKWRHGLCAEIKSKYVKGNQQTSYAWHHLNCVFTILDQVFPTKTKTCEWGLKKIPLLPKMHIACERKLGQQTLHGKPQWGHAFTKKREPITRLNIRPK